MLKHICSPNGLLGFERRFTTQTYNNQDDVRKERCLPQLAEPKMALFKSCTKCNPFQALVAGVENAWSPCHTLLKQGLLQKSAFQITKIYAVLFRWVHPVRTLAPFFRGPCEQNRDLKIFHFVTVTRVMLPKPETMLPLFQVNKCLRCCML